MLLQESVGAHLRHAGKVTTTFVLKGIGEFTHNVAVYSTALSPDQKYVAAALQDKSVHIFLLKSEPAGNEIFQISYLCFMHTHYGISRCLGIDDNASSVLLADGDGRMHVHYRKIDVWREETIWGNVLGGLDLYADQYEFNPYPLIDPLMWHISYKHGDSNFFLRRRRWPLPFRESYYWSLSK